MGFFEGYWVYKGSVGCCRDRCVYQGVTDAEGVGLAICFCFRMVLAMSGS